MTNHSEEIAQRERFPFGDNWKRFLVTLDDDRINSAHNSLKIMLQLDNLVGKTFLDVGCGSGLFSLVAKQLGAQVRSFDFDPESVACAQELKRRYYPNDPSWQIEEGSVLDVDYMNRLGLFDVVYSWGVLHHTGEMGAAITSASKAVKRGGLFFIAIYNDQGGASRRWFKVKSAYNRLHPLLRPIMVFFIALTFESKYAFVRLLRRKNPLPFRDWSQKKKERGMSAWHDWVDWIGGLPFEVAKPEEIILPMQSQGFVLQNITTSAGGFACNQYVFKKL